jgi:hypothetical protein
MMITWRKTMTQTQIMKPGPLLNPDGSLAQAGWSPQPLLDCNLEAARSEGTPRFWQPMRIKRWDYYGITTPTHFFSFTVSHVGYLASIFAYVLEFDKGKYTEKTLTLPFSRKVSLPRNSTEGTSIFNDGKVRLEFSVLPGRREIRVNWPSFSSGTPLKAEAAFACPPEQESMVITIPIAGNRFYYNRKTNCMPATGWVESAGIRYDLNPRTCLGNLDWGRGIWEYKSFWVWASASGFLPGGKQTIGLNLGFGFGNTRAATENCFILDGRVHKLGEVDFTYSNQNFMKPWTMKSADKRIDLTFTPFFDRNARTDLSILRSEVHQMFGRYNGTVVSDEGKKLEIMDLIGWAEEHQAKW